MTEVVGTYDLVGLNGSLLPAEIDDGSEPETVFRAFLLGGELDLAEDYSYGLRLTARYDTTCGASYTKELDSAGTWRFLTSALDSTSGEIRLEAPNGGMTIGAVTRLSLVLTTRAPWAGKQGMALTWVYIRRLSSRRGARPSG